MKKTIIILIISVLAICALFTACGRESIQTTRTYTTQSPATGYIVTTGSVDTTVPENTVPATIVPVTTMPVTTMLYIENVTVDEYISSLNNKVMSYTSAKKVYEKSSVKNYESPTVVNIEHAFDDNGNYSVFYNGADGEKTYTYTDGVIYKSEFGNKTLRQIPKEDAEQVIEPYIRLSQSVKFKKECYENVSYTENKDGGYTIVFSGINDANLEKLTGSKNMTAEKFEYTVVSDKNGNLVKLSSETLVTMSKVVMISESISLVYTNINEKDVVKTPADKEAYVNIYKEGAVKNLLLIGDSISVGTTLPFYNKTESLNFADNFGSIIAGVYGLERCDTYRNIAVEGYKSSDVLNTVKNNTKLIKNADTICITMGGNDVIGSMLKILSIMTEKSEAELSSMQDLFDTMATSGSLDFAKYSMNYSLNIDEINTIKQTVVNNYTANLEEICKIINDNNPEAKVIIQTVFNPCDAPNDEVLSKISAINALIIEGFIDTVNNAIKTKSELYGFSVVDTAGAFDQKADVYTYMTDSVRDIHPNEEGHKLIALMILETITKQ